MKVIIEVRQNLIVLDERCLRSRCLAEIACVVHRVSGRNGIAEVPRIPQLMAGCDRGGIGRRKRRKQGMTVCEVHPIVPEGEHRWRILRVHRAVT